MALDAKSSASQIGPTQQPNRTENFSVLGLQPDQHPSLVPTNLSCPGARGRKTRFGLLHKLVVDGKAEYAHKVSSKAELARESSKEQHHACMLRTVIISHPLLLCAWTGICPTVTNLTGCAQEYQAFQRLGSHRNIVNFVEAFEDGDRVHLVTSPYCSGGTLLERLTAGTGAPVSESHLAKHFKQVVEAVGWCHRRGEATSHQPYSQGYTAKELYSVITVMKPAICLIWSPFLLCFVVIYFLATICKAQIKSDYISFA